MSIPSLLFGVPNIHGSYPVNIERWHRTLGSLTIPRHFCRIRAHVCAVYSVLFCAVGAQFEIELAFAVVFKYFTVRGYSGRVVRSNSND